MNLTMVVERTHGTHRYRPHTNALSRDSHRDDMNLRLGRILSASKQGKDPSWYDLDYCHDRGDAWVLFDVGIPVTSAF